MAMVGEVIHWFGMLIAGMALVATAAIAYLALLRWLFVIVAGIVLFGFSFGPDLQLRFTSTLLGGLAILYLPPLLMALVWRQVATSRVGVVPKVDQPSYTEMEHQSFAEEQTRDCVERKRQAIHDRRDRDDETAQARDLERQGMVSLWSRP